MLDGFGKVPSYPEPRDDDIVVSQSTIGSMQLCPGRVGLSQVEGFYATPSEAMFFGSVVHHMIEKFLLLGDPGAWPFELSTTEAIRQAMDDAAVDESHGTAGHFVIDEVATPDQVLMFIAEIRESVMAWYSQVWTAWFHEINITAMEQKLIMPLGILPDGRAVWLRGTPDVTTGGGIYDWKTSKKAWLLNSDGLSKGSFGPQAPLYLALTGQRSGHFTFVVYDRATQKWETHPTVWSEEQVKASVLNAWETGKQIGAQGFPYTPFESSYGKYKRGWHCSPQYCGAWDVCPGKDSISDGVDTTVKIDRRW